MAIKPAANGFSIANQAVFKPILKTWRRASTHPQIQTRQTSRAYGQEDDMKSKQIVLRTAGMILLVGALLGMGHPLQAGEESGERSSKAEARAIEGVWHPIVTIRDCQTQAALFSFPSLDIYIRGGGLLVEASSPPATRATGMGAWRHSGGRNYTSVYQFFTYNADGSPAGGLKVSSQIRLGANGTTFRSSETGEDSDLNGHVVAQVCATREAARLQ
jgi:hypothetical protein